MSSQRRAPIIPDIPPYSTKAGGPLQARHATNQTQSHYADMRGGHKPSTIKAVMAPPQQPVSHQDQQRRSAAAVSATSGRDARPSSSSQRASSRTQPEAEPRPSSRLANEKKKDYKDPPNIGPWKLGKLIGQGASGEWTAFKITDGDSLNEPRCHIHRPSQTCYSHVIWYTSCRQDCSQTDSSH